MRWLFRAAVMVAITQLAACAAGPGFSERDRFVNSTPKYYDNRVFFLASQPVGERWELQGSQAAKVGKTDPARINHGSPLSIILNSVSLPPADVGADGKPKDQSAKDIAVVLDVATKTTGADESIVAWYQRGVQPDQALNFSNLLLYFDPRWDARVAPLIRIRVVDVSSEKNAEVRETLGQVKQFIGSIGPILPTSSDAIVSVASRAATLILTRPNKQLLDYTVQFYSQEQLEESYGSDLTPLKRGRVLLIGRPLGERSAFWRNFKGYYDGATLQAYNNDALVSSPVAVVTISTAQSIVPTLVAARSTYLQKLLSSGQQADLDGVTAAGKGVWDGVRTYTLLEELHRSRDQDSLTKVFDAYNDTADDSLSADDKALLRETLRSISTCDLSTSNKIAAWWAANNSKIQFETDKFKLKGDTCPS